MILGFDTFNSKRDTPVKLSPRHCCCGKTHHRQTEGVRVHGENGGLLYGNHIPGFPTDADISPNHKTNIFTILPGTICTNAGEVRSKHVDRTWQDERTEGVSGWACRLEIYLTDICKLVHFRSRSPSKK